MNDELNKVDQSEINEMAWKACDTFRGIVDPSEYKNYILVMLFLKYITDIWQDHYEEYRQKFGDDDERIRRRLERERFKLPEGSDFYTLYESRNADNIGELINEALDSIEEANKAKLGGVFRNIDYNSDDKLGDPKERNARLKSLLEDFANEKMNLRPSRVGDLDIIGNTYEYLIEKFAAGAGKKGGEFYTPPEVGWLLAKLVDPKPGDRICDPTCGSASLLIKAGLTVKSKDFALYGHESNGDTWALSKMNLFLHNMDSARVERCNTFTNPKLLEGDNLMRFEVVIANPPFSLDKWWSSDTSESPSDDKYRRFHRGIPPKSRGDYAFISHMVETLTETDGRMAVIAPLGVLFRGGAERQIRKALIDENLLDTVIGLPSAIFYGTGIPVCILILKKNRKHKDVLFIDASREFEPGKRQNKLRDQDIEKIISTFNSRKEIEKYSHKADLEEMKENDFNLNIPRYVDTYEEEEEIDIQAVQKEIEELEAELVQVRDDMDGYLKELGF